MLLTEGELREVIKARTKEGRISCAEAMEIAKETKTPTLKMGQVLDDMGVRIVHCQLGCFE
jgi:hypothetical protein